MPDWISIDMHVKGDRESVTKFRKKHFVNEDGEERLDFAAIIPMPKELEGVDQISNKEGDRYVRDTAGLQEVIPIEQVDAWKEKYGAAYWYDWNIRNWGTKWNAEMGSVSERNNGDQVELEVWFGTAWSFPYSWFHKLLDSHPELEISARYRDYCALGLMVTLERLPPDEDDEEEAEILEKSAESLAETVITEVVPERKSREHH